MIRTNLPFEVCSTGTFRSPLGAIHFATDERDRLCAVCFHGDDVLHRDVTGFHGTPAKWADDPSNTVQSALQAYFEGDCAAIDSLEVRLCGTAFEASVWTALRAIPTGQTSTYGAIAQQVGRSGAARAVGMANGRNPVALVVPCHRVIGSGGKLVGYGAGLDRKRWLLAHEAGEITLF